MPKQSNLNKEDVIYCYDGSYDGFLCCVYAGVYRHEMPVDIVSEQEIQPSLFAIRSIQTEREKAARVRASIPNKISVRAKELIETVFLSCAEKKELKMMRFLLLGYQQGAKVVRMMGHKDVAPLLEAEKHLTGEVHLLKGFVRFADFDGVLAATIAPKNFVLPFLAEHFMLRYSQERFMIFDKTHKAALVYQEGQQQIIPLEGIELPKADPKEKEYQNMWKQFCKTISIEARENKRCQMTHMPKRYWANMTEMQEFA